VSLRGADNCSALEWATRRGHSLIRDILVQHESGTEASEINRIISTLVEGIPESRAKLIESQPAEILEEIKWFLETRKQHDPEGSGKGLTHWLKSLSTQTRSNLATMLKIHLDGRALKRSHSRT
jgi:hypothetical protein